MIRRLKKHSPSLITVGTQITNPDPYSGRNLNEEIWFITLTSRIETDIEQGEGKLSSRKL